MKAYLNLINGKKQEQYIKLTEKQKDEVHSVLNDIRNPSGS